jgi:hypothetical protein
MLGCSDRLLQTALGPAEHQAHGPLAKDADDAVLTFEHLPDEGLGAGAGIRRGLARRGA